MAEHAPVATPDIGTRIARQSAALAAEIAFIKKTSGDQQLELTAGERDTRSAGPGGVYVFLLAEAGVPLPDDAGGTLRMSAGEVKAYVVGNEGNRIWLLLESTEQLTAFIPTATLTLSQTDLLERLKARLDEIDTKNPPGMLAEVYGYKATRVDFGIMPERVAERVGDGGASVAIAHALGSEVTYLWGPPGTGKTFTIAALVASLVEVGESVLVTSHTHAAVEQALWAAIEPPSDGRTAGLLHGTDWARDGNILKVGPLRDPKIPSDCHLDSRLEEDSARRQAALESLVACIAPKQEQLNELRKKVRAWDDRAAARKALDEAVVAEAKALSELAAAQQAKSAADSNASSARAAVKAAGASFVVGRRKRVAAAQRILDASMRAIASGEAAVAGATSAVVVAVTAREQAAARHDAVITSAGSPSDEARDRAEIAQVSTELAKLQSQADELRAANANLANELLNNAKALFTTLTKLFMSPQLQGRKWGTVIVDEASMAQPPLVTIAACAAAKRVVVCGDFLQLPPIVHSNDGIAAEELGKSLFDLRGISDSVRYGNEPAELAKLMVQRRMAPAIAEVARTLAYGSQLVDAPETSLRHPSPAVGALAVTDDLADAALAPILSVDVSAVGPWSGKQRGSLSRFNMHTAQASLELAALYAARISKPGAGDARPIGIVTPFAAQKRYLAKVLEAMGDLSRWVMVGTVHTFQGNECDVIIFDTVLGDPHWSARLTDPHSAAEVMRDLNVAVTRARHQFLLVGDAKWLDKHAKAGSGLGNLWAHMRAAGPVLDVVDVLGEGFLAVVKAEELEALGWSENESASSVVMYDEMSFYPALIADLAAAREQIVMFTPFIGKTRWPKISPHVLDAAKRGVEVVVLHKPLTDPEWKQKDPDWGRKVFAQMAHAGVTLIGVSGVHAKTIVIDGRVVYEGSLNWASQTSSYEHMLRLDSRNVAALVERMMQLRELIPNFRVAGGPDGTCPHCGAPLVVINQAAEQRFDTSKQPIKLGCSNYATNKHLCKGYIRGGDQRGPFLTPPTCPKGQQMGLMRDKNKKPHSWVCDHGCPKIRWRAGDIEPRQQLASN